MEDLLFCAPAFSTKSRFSTLLTVTDADGDPMELWELDATGIICDDELSPAQMKNLQDELDAKVMDRTLVILDIFAARASTSEGKIQVELAQLKYRQARLDLELPCQGLAVVSVREVREKRSWRWTDVLLKIGSHF